MSREKIDFDVVQEIARKLPNVEESSLHGAPSLKVSGRLLTCPALHRSAEPNSLVVRINIDQRTTLLAANRKVYYLTDHYVNHPTVLVRLGEIDRRSLKDLLELAWQFASLGRKSSRHAITKSQKEPNMTKTKTSIRFKAKLLRPAMESARPRADQREKSDDSWTFLILPKNASAKLPSRGQTLVEGTINGVSFQSVLEPDGQKSHWLKVDRKLRKAARAEAGDVVTLEIAPAAGRTGTYYPGRFEKSSRRGRPEGERIVVGHHNQCASGLDPLDHLCQTARDARAPNQKCLLDVSRREAPRLLLRPIRVL